MNKYIFKCRDQATMRKDNYVYFVTTNGSLEKRETLPKSKNLQKGTAKEIKKGNYYHSALPIEGEAKDNLPGTINNTKLSIYPLH